MELPPLHVQGHPVQHGRVQGALRLRLLEGEIARGEAPSPGRHPGICHGRIRPHHGPLQGVKHPTRAKPKGKQKLKVPDYFLAALQKSRKALVIFEGFNYSNKKDYVEWVTEAKGEETRKRRLETAVAWMSEGKTRNWKYMTK